MENVILVVGALLFFVGFPIAIWLSINSGAGRGTNGRI